uniref:PH domain-containing protein n=1 Tax=Globisporangium ultimum (strain ATCC 200006 / CBS 805.95 / DAOM BR144) TaxID=431595 RepID=K3X6M7_GLOUD
MATDLSASTINLGGGAGAGGGGDGGAADLAASRLVVSSASSAPASENAYEKLSREVHQMQITGAIHTDWLENPKGYLLKPDFKRKAQHVGAGGKKLNSSRVLRIHLPGNTYRMRWFVLDGMILRYFKSNTEEQELGAIHLTSVNAVLPSSVADAPENALDLVCADRIYTIAGNDREDMVRWATVLTLVLRGEYKPKLMQRPESTIIRGSSVIPRPSAIARKTAMIHGGGSRFTDANGIRMTGTLGGDGDQKSHDEELKEKIITVTFDQPGPLNLILRGTVDDEVMVCGFQDTSGDGGSPAMGLAEASGVIRVGDLLISINNHYFTNIEFKQAIALIRDAGRPLTLRFSRIDQQTPPGSTRIAEGWILSKEPAAHRFRIRMLQLNGDKLNLFKPSMQGGRVDEPYLSIRMDEVMDIRPTNDVREVVSAFTQCHPKQWGITLEGTKSIFTFYTRNREDMIQWVDLLKNSPLFCSGDATRLSIPVHPVAVVAFNPVLAPKVLLQDDIGKMGDLVPTFACHRFVLLEDGKVMYFVDEQSAASRTRPIGTLRCDSIISIVPSQITEKSSNDRVVPGSSFPSTGGGNSVTWSDFDSQETAAVTEESMPWRLELGLIVHGSMQKYRRPFVLCFPTQEKMMKWGICIARESKRLTGQEYDLSSISRRSSRSNSQSYSRQSETNPFRLAVSRLMANQSKYTDPNVTSDPVLFRSLKDVSQQTATRGWFFIKKPKSTGMDAYHPRFIVLNDNELLLFKYEVLDDENLHSYSSVLDLRSIKDVREAESGYQENLDFTIQLTTEDGVAWMLVAETHAQKETWLSSLIWLSDYHYRGSFGASDDGMSSPSGRTKKRFAMKNAGLMRSIPESEDELLEGGSKDLDGEDDPPSPAPSNHHLRPKSRPTPIAQSPFSVEGENVTEISGTLQIAGRKVFAAISNGVFHYYERKEDYMNEWGDAIDAISLKKLDDVHSDGVDAGSFVVKFKGEHEVQLIAENAKLAKRWMLVMCSCGELILKKMSRMDSWASTQPKEAWIWKLDRLYQIFRRRYFSLRNHQLIFYTEPNGRLLGMISLPCIFNLKMSRVCGRSKEDADFYQLEISFAIPTAAEENSRTDQIGDFYAFLLAFDTEQDLKDWASAIYDCCTNSMSLKSNSSLPPLGDIQIMPKELLKTSTFETNENHEDSFSSSTSSSTTSGISPVVVKRNPQEADGFSSSGWLYYRTSTEERIRLRYFVQWGYELSIYKHELSPDEANAIRYGVIDCRALVDVRFAYVNSPENAVELILGSDISVIIIPRTDEEAVMWRNSLLDVK